MKKDNIYNYQQKSKGMYMCNVEMVSFLCIFIYVPKLLASLHLIIIHFDTLKSFSNTLVVAPHHFPGLNKERLELASIYVTILKKCHYPMTQFSQ